MRLNGMAAVVTFLSVLAMLGTTSAAQAEKHAHPQKFMPQWSPIDITGEVVDSWCYASKSVGDGRGPDHAACARACVHGGVTIGIVDDSGKMYIASKTKAYSGCQALLEPYVAKRVHIKGMLATIGGCPLLKVNSVEEVTGKSANEKPAGAQYHGQASKPASSRIDAAATHPAEAKRQTTK